MPWGEERDWTVTPVEPATPDVVASGPSGRLVRTWVLLAVAAAALIAWVAYDHATARPQAGPSAAPPSQVVTERIVATPVPANLGLGVLIVPTAPPRLFDTGTRTTRPIGGLPGSAAWSYEVFDLGGGRFVVTAREPYADLEVFLVRMPAGQATPVAVGDSMVVGADRASVLVTRAVSAADLVVQRYGLDGRAIGAAVPVPQGESLRHETVAGWLLETGTGWVLRDPATGQRRGGFEHLLAASSANLAYTPPEGDLTVLGLSVDAASSIALRVDQVPTGVHAAIFSDTDRYLAVYATDRAATAHTVMVLDLTTGQWSVMPGLPVRIRTGGPAVTMAWTGEVLTLACANGDVVVWQPGSPIVYAVPWMITPPPHPFERPEPTASMGITAG